MMLLVSAADLIALYLGLELMSLSLYVLAAFERDNVRAAEAGLKYFVLGALSSGMLLYGASLIYGFTGTVTFTGIAQAAGQGGVGLVFGIVFLFAGFCFKVSAVPFHMWTPDVYEGAPTPITAFFAAAPKVAAIAMFVRATIVSFPGDRHPVAADRRVRGDRLDGARRLRGDRPAQHQAADGLFVDRPHGLRADRPCRRDRGGRARRRRLHGDLPHHDARHLRLHPGDAARRRHGGGDRRPRRARAHQPRRWRSSSRCCLFSLAGVPPLAGFFAKFYVFLAAIKAGLYTLAVIGVLASVVGAYYYLMIIKIMYFDEPKPSFAPMPGELKAVLAVTGLFNIFFVVYPAPLLDAAAVAAKSLF